MVTLIFPATRIADHLPDDETIWTRLFLHHGMTTIADGEGLEIMSTETATVAIETN